LKPISSWEHIKQLIDLICKKHTVRPSDLVLSRFTLSQQWARDFIRCQQAHDAEERVDNCKYQCRRGE
jgi:hypothetical protein